MKYIHQLFIVFFIVALAACEKDDILNEKEVPQLEEQSALKQKVYDVMHEWYLWNDELPAIDMNTFETASELLEAMKKKPVDKWSYIEKEEDYDNYFENGQYEGYGFSMVWDTDEKLKVAYVYEDSPFFRAGVGRAWVINKINGNSVNALLDEGTFDEAFGNATNTFEFTDGSGNTVSKTITKSTIGINSVLYKNVFSIDDQPVGYLVFNNFLQTSLAELQESFSYFQQEGIQDLILDLRYNGGGRVNMARYITTNILGTRSAGQEFIRFIYNQDKAAEHNVVDKFDAPEYPLNLNRLIVITSKGTASASELVINSLKPFIDVVLIGDDTYGKPVGSFPIKYSGYAINPISFKIVNQNGEGEYFEGIQADAYVTDDLSHDFGDYEEARLKEALYFIQNGSFSGQIARMRPAKQVKPVPMSGFRQEIGAF